MNTKTYDNVTVKEEKGSVILITPSMTSPLIMSRKTWRSILADKCKSIMRGEDRSSDANNR